MRSPTAASGGPALPPLPVALAGALALATVMGIGRFAYTPLLPRMQDALGWSIAQAGDVATANFIGYLFGALLAGRLASRATRAHWLVGALVLSAVTSAAGAVAWSFAGWLAIRFVAGAVAALGVVLGTTLVLDHLAQSARPGLVSLYFSGVGVGIVVSVVLIEAARHFGQSVFAQWAVLGVTAGACVAWALRVLLRLPNLRPTRPATAAAPRGLMTRELQRVIAAYGLLGFGYVITATFLVAMARQLDSAVWLEPVSWIVVGATAAPSVPLVQGLAARYGSFPVMRAAFIVEAVGVLLAAYGDGATAVLVGAACLGATFLSITSLVLGAARALGGAQADGVVGWMTAAFGFGQLIGPALAGRLATVDSSFGPPSTLAATALVLAALLVPRGNLRRPV